MGVEVSPVQVPCLKSDDNSLDFNVTNMLTDPPEETRGIKRKARGLDEDEDDLSSSSEEEDFPSYQRRREIVFNMSVCKLSRYRQAADPSLLRSVLVCNTLRTIERELDRDGVKVPSGPSGGIPFLPSVNPHAGCLARLTLDPPPAQHPPQPYPQYDSECYNPAQPANDCDRYLLDMDGSSGRLTPFVRTPECGALWTDDSTDRLPSLNWSSVLNFNNSSGSAHSSSNGTVSSPTYESSSSLYTLMPPSSSGGSSPVSCTNSASSSSCSSSGSTGSDEIFGDIDLSLYDFDLLSPLSPPNVKLAPVSAEELMRSLSSADSASNCHMGPGQSGGYCYKSLSGDRDHITPVLS